MKKLLILSFLIFIISLENKSFAESYSGNDLLKMCAGNKEDKYLCAVYIRGILDAKKTIEAWEKNTCYLYIAPQNVTYGQAIDIIVKGLQDNPKDRNLTASSLALNYLSEAYPCENK